MADNNWQKVREVFDSALRRKPAERRKFVNEVCGDNKALLAEVESLLSSFNSADSFLETPAVAKVADIIVTKTEKPAPGAAFNHYEIVKQIGEGGMGEVYLAKDVNLNRKVALKLLGSHITEDKNRVSRFRQEAFAISALNHPNIVTIYEIGKWQDRDFIVTEFIEGATLREFLRNKKRSIGEALDIALQTASALAAAHGAGIVHRDIKPENIMIRGDGLVKVLDFGIAKYRPTANGLKALIETEVGEIIGTAAYMSPEQARGLEVDAQTDIWGLGVILYEMLAGRLPFEGATKSDRIAAILEREPASLTKTGGKLSTQLQQIVDRALAKDKKERYADIAEMAEDLHRLRDATGDKFLPPLILPVRKQIVSPRARLFAVASVLVLLIAAIGLWFNFSNSRKSAAEAKKSIAVLPLKPIGAMNRDEIYEVGIADSLINKLGAMKGFVVRPLSATRKYDDINQDPFAAGRE
jgi:serine/threonine protein kinase